MYLKLFLTVLSVGCALVTITENVMLSSVTKNCFYIKLTLKQKHFFYFAGDDATAGHLRRHRAARHVHFRVRNFSRPRENEVCDGKKNFIPHRMSSRHRGLHLDLLRMRIC